MTMYSPYAAEPDLVADMDTNPNGMPPPEQYGYNACQSFGGGFALEGHHKRAGQPIIVKRLATYRLAMEFSLGGPVGNNGASVNNVAQAWGFYGVPHGPGPDASPWEPVPADILATAAQYKGVVLDSMPYIRSGPAKDNVIESLFMWLDRGYFIIATVRDTRSLHDDARGQYNWHTMDWDGSYATATGADHVVTICGGSRQYGRFLFANHWGEQWGDGGFGGAPFDKFLTGPQGCFTNLQIIKNCRVQPVGVRTMPNAFPGPFTLAQQDANTQAIKAKLTAAFLAGHSAAPAGTNPDIAGYLAALAKGGEMNISDKQFEASAPGLQPLPRGTVREFVDRGDFAWPVGMREEQGE